MSKNQLLKILTHPFFIGFIITAIIALIVMPDVSKYKTDVEEIRYNMVIIMNLDNPKDFDKIAELMAKYSVYKK